MIVIICKICGKEFKKMRAHVSKCHKIDPVKYYIKYELNSLECPRCIICGEHVNKFLKNSMEFGLSPYCSLKCSRKGHSQKMQELHKQDCYKGTSYFINYNKTKEHSELISKISKERRLDKKSKGFNSEYSDRIRNRDNLCARFLETDLRYLYVLEYRNKIKLGSTSCLDRRMSNLDGFITKHLFEGFAHHIAYLECELFLQFIDYTLLDETESYYTEYLSKDCLPKLLKVIKYKF